MRTYQLLMDAVFAKPGRPSRTTRLRFLLLNTNNYILLVLQNLYGSLRQHFRSDLSVEGQELFDLCALQQYDLAEAVFHLGVPYPLLCSCDILPQMGT